MYLGIEIGGTKLQLGVGEGDGVLAGLWRGTIDPTAVAEGIRRQIAQAVPELLSRAGLSRDQIEGVGVGFGGPVNDKNQSVIKSHQIEGWDNFRLAAWIEELLGWPAVMGNDADLAGLAEALFGAGRGLSPIFYITIGSGIGGGLIINGEIYRGVGRGAAEIGHLRVPGNESPFGNFRVRELEQIASGWALQQEARRLIREGVVTRKHSLLATDGPDAITAQHVAAACEQGDGWAAGILLPAWDYLAEAICHVVALLCPQRIVIGGGVSLMGEKLLFHPLRTRVAERVFKPFADCFDIVPAALGEEVVVHGGLALARQRLKKQ